MNMYLPIAMIVEPSMLDQIAKAITDFTASIASHFIAFLSAMAGVGILSMAIMQAIKDTFPVRRAFQRQWLKRWFVCKAGEAAKGGRGTVNLVAAETDLIRLATDGNANAFYDLPIEQLAGQFNAAIQIVLDSPARHRDLMTTTAARADASDLQLLFEPPPAVTLPLNPSDLNQATVRQQFIDARTRVTHQVQRAIDSIQISAGFRWKFYLQLAAFLLSGLIAGFGVWMFFSASGGAKFITALVTAVLGGFLAPVARDLVAALQQLRK
jgi:hypothetical protein